jgi:hypothetical protein
MHHSSIRSAVRTAETNKFKAQLVFRISMQLILSFFALMSVIRTFFFSLSLSLDVYIKQTFDHFFNRIIMENMTKTIPELLQQIRQVENEHNQLVDEYFQMSI